MKIRSFLTLIVSFSLCHAVAQLNSWSDCCGSAKPYPVPTKAVEYPDSLTPMMINHVGRHGARYQASPAHAMLLQQTLADAHRQNTITPLGVKFEALLKEIIARSVGLWGALDSVGAAEQRGIAARMYAAYPELFQSPVATLAVDAISSYVPRCVMSMYEFQHELSRITPRLQLSSLSGPQYNPLMRFFDQKASPAQVEADSKAVAEQQAIYQSMIPTTAIRKLVGSSYRFKVDSTQVAMAEYSILAGMPAMGMQMAMPQYFTLQEANQLWEAFNIKQYFDHSATTFSNENALKAQPLLETLLAEFDRFIARGGADQTRVHLHFGHAETLMPLLALMQLPGCYYLTYNFDTVASHWKDFEIVPMAANLQMILFRSETGRYYLRIDVNECPVAFMGQQRGIYIPWQAARLRF